MKNNLYAAVAADETAKNSTYRSPNGGPSWTPGIPRRNSNWKSINSGATWRPAVQGLAGTLHHQLVYDAPSDSIATDDDDWTCEETKSTGSFLTTASIDHVQSHIPAASACSKLQNPGQGPSAKPSLTTHGLNGEDIRLTLADANSGTPAKLMVDGTNVANEWLEAQLAGDFPVAILAGHVCWTKKLMFKNSLRRWVLSGLVLSTLLLGGCLPIANVALLPIVGSDPDAGRGPDAGQGEGPDGGADAGMLPLAAGIVAEWYQGNSDVLTLPYVQAGQIVVEWADVETGEAGHYDWSKIDSALGSANRPMTLQVNGNQKPPFLFKNVPYVAMGADWVDSQVDDVIPGTTTKAVLMYWHPAFVADYANLIKALGMHLAATGTSGHNVIAFRQNFNGVGTEHLAIPSAYRAASGWTVPGGVPAAPDWIPAAQLAYERVVLDAHVKGFVLGDVSRPPVFVRNNLDAQLLSSTVTGQGFTYEHYFNTGVLGWFHTSSEAEPRPSNVDQYERFEAYCRPGLTLGLAEPYADAWGVHGVQTDLHWQTPPQFNYWTLLSDLQMGISYLEVYGADLEIALNGTRNGANVGSQYQGQFDAAFRFGAKYAGYAGHPDLSPGAWVAFRQSNSSLTTYDAVTDYNELLRLLNPESTVAMDARTDGTPVAVLADLTGSGQFSIGPYWQRFGSWARKLPSGQSALLGLDSMFQTSLNARGTKVVNITYLDTGTGGFTVRFAGETHTQNLGNSGQWQRTSFTTSGNFAGDSSGASLVLSSAGADVVFHMVEVTY